MNTSLFGKTRLGYALVESARTDEWRRFGHEGLGMHVDTDNSGALAFRLDEHERRLIVRRGPAEDVVALGFQVDDDAALAEICARLRARGVELHDGSAEEARLRGVEAFVAFAGPKRMGLELFTRARLSSTPLRAVGSGFVTCASGMGHVAVFTQEPEAFQAFWEGVFDARVSDRIEDKIGGTVMDFTFLRLNERHHSVAVASTRGKRMNPLRTSIHHLNLQAASFDDVVGAYRRCRQMGYGIANAIGQHPNDKELSFYVVTPSDFEMELGWNPIVVNEDNWQVGSHRGISLWGHFKENQSLGSTLRQAGRGIASLRRKEHIVGEPR